MGTLDNIWTSQLYKNVERLWTNKVKCAIFVLVVLLQSNRQTRLLSDCCVPTGVLLNQFRTPNNSVCVRNVCFFFKCKSFFFFFLLFFVSLVTTTPAYATCLRENGDETSKSCYHNSGSEEKVRHNRLSTSPSFPFCMWSIRILIIR